MPSLLQVFLGVTTLLPQILLLYLETEGNCTLTPKEASHLLGKGSPSCHSSPWHQTTSLCLCGSLLLQHYACRVPAEPEGKVAAVSPQ